MKWIVLNSTQKLLLLLVLVSMSIKLKIDKKTEFTTTHTKHENNDKVQIIAYNCNEEKVKALEMCWFLGYSDRQC